MEKHGRQVTQRFAKGRQERQSARDVMRAATENSRGSCGSPVPVRTQIAYSGLGRRNSNLEHCAQCRFPKWLNPHGGTNCAQGVAARVIRPLPGTHSLRFFCCRNWVPLLPSAAMSAPQPDHRGKRRVRTKVRATVTANSRSMLAETRDISTGGMFLYADGAFDVGSEIQIVLMLPRELGLV